MRNKQLLGLAVVSLALAGATNTQAQPYSNAVMALNPVGYWPLQETTQPPFGYYIATNLGTAGALAQGYYQTWFQRNGTGFYPTNNIQQITGVTGDGDAAMGCNRTTGSGQYVIFPRQTNGVANAALTIQAPFTVEAWLMSGNTNNGLQPIITEGRNPADTGAALNYTNMFAGFSLGQYKNFFYWQVYNQTIDNNNGYPEIDTPPLVPNTWYHVVAECDGTNISLYLNGNLVTTKLGPAPNYRGNRYEPDVVSPLLIGTGTQFPSGNGGVEFLGGIDEVAVYPTNLDASLILNHYNDVSNTTYAATVLADSPSIYLRLDEPAMTTYPDPGTFPVANNYGTLGTAANGVYQPGTTPAVGGPPYSGFGTGSHAVAFNGFYGNVDIGAGSVAAALNPTGYAAVTVAAWFKGPVDGRGRYQIIVGHSDASWRLGYGTLNGDNHFNPGPGPELQFANIQDVVTNNFYCNDGNWHFVVGTSDGTNEALYIDGALAKTNTGVGSIAGSGQDVFIGGDPTYLTPVYNGGNVMRGFAGSIAQVAYWTNVLSAAQIGQLYDTASVPPTIFGQPVSQTVNSGSLVSLSVAARGSNPINYQWYKNGSSIPGATASSLVFNPVALGNAGTYYATVANAAGSVTSAVATLTVYGAPIITGQSPTSIQVFRGTSPTLHVTAIGPSPAYQWSVNGSPISGATASSYTIANVQNNGSYTCAVTNSYGSTPISSINVSVLAAPTAPYPAAVLADHPASYYRLDEASGTTAWDYAGGLNATYTNATLGQPGYTSLFTPQTDPTETSVQFGQGMNDMNKFAGWANYQDFGTPAGSSRSFSVEAWVQPNGSQFSDGGIVAIGYGYGGEQFAIDTGGRVAAGRTYRFYVNDASGSSHGVSSSNASATSDNAWHHLVGICDEPNGKVLLYVDGVLAGSTVIGTNSGINALTSPLAIGARLDSAAATAYTNQFVGNIDDVAMYNVALSSNQVVTHFLAAGIAPIFTELPTSPALGYFTNYLTLNEGATLTLTGAAIGTAPVTYQWYDYTGTAVPGQTTTTLTIPNINSSQNGLWYYLGASNTYGTSNSAYVVLNIIAGPPYISTDITPLYDTVREGTPFSYTVVPGGSAPFQYQWYQNGTAIANATNATYSFPALVGTNTYYVHVTNAQGAADSSTATLVATPVPQLNGAQYGYRMKIQFTGYNRGESLLNFPALVKLSSALPGFSYNQFVLPNGGDLRFTDSSGYRMVPHEIDQWNDSNGVSTVWVQIPALTGTNDYIYAYWGNNNPTNALPTSSVWLPDYTAVYHLKEPSLPFVDSTGQYTATNGSTSGIGSGIVGLGEVFNGANYVDQGVVTLSNTFTVSVWASVSPTANNIQILWANGPGGFSSAGYRLYVNHWRTTDGAVVLESGTGSGGSELDAPANSVQANGWHQVVLAVDHDAAQASIFVDGALVASGSSNTGTPLNTQAIFGATDDIALPLNGGMDEARIAVGLSSVNKVWADYMTASQNSAFETYGNISAQRALTSAISGTTLNLSWSTGTLQSAPAVTGPYTDISGATNGTYSVQMTGPQKFYRVRIQ